MKKISLIVIEPFAGGTEKQVSDSPRCLKSTAFRQNLENPLLIKTSDIEKLPYWSAVVALIKTPSEVKIMDEKGETYPDRLR